jgi:hypothetical protein
MKHVGGLATIESRQGTLQKVIDSILPQLDELIVVCNGFTIPQWMFGKKYDKCFAVAYDDNRGDAEKFIFADNSRNSIYYTIDDDLIYPPTYCAYLEAGLLNYGGVVGLHGRTYPRPVTDFLKWKDNYRCLRYLDQDVTVDLIGTGCMAFYTNQVRVSLDDFPYQNMADVQFSRLCHEQKIPMHVLKHDSTYLLYIPYKNTIYCSHPDKSIEASLLKTFLK